MKISLQIVETPDDQTLTQRQFHMDAKSMIIGRDYSADITLPDSTKTLSRKHLEITKSEDGKYCLKKIGKSETRFNEDELPYNVKFDLSDGDVLAFCGYKISFGILQKGNVSSTKDTHGPKNSQLNLGNRMNLESDLDAEEPLLHGKDEQEVVHYKGVSNFSNNSHTDQELLYDPFASSDEIIGQDLDQQGFDKMDVMNKSKQNETVERFESKGLPVENTRLQMASYRENIYKAMENSIERFLDEIDPSMMQAEYDEFMSIFARRKTKYWRIHCKQFTKKKNKGEFRRIFMAIFSEELRKL
jgi:type VI secretion system protein ImpI